MSLRIVSIGIAIILALCVIVVTLFNKNRTLTEENEQLVTFDKTNQKQLTWYINTLGKQVARVKVVELDNKNLKALRESDRVSFVRQFEGVKRNLRNVSTAISIDGGLTDSFTLVLKDTIGGKVFQASPDRFSKVSGLVSGDLIRIKQSRVITLKGAIFWQRKRFLGLRIGRKEYSFDVVSEDPSLRITGLEAIRVTKR